MFCSWIGVFSCVHFNQERVLSLKANTQISRRLIVFTLGSTSPEALEQILLNMGTLLGCNMFVC